LEELEQADDGWFYDPNYKLGIAYVKTQSIPTDESFHVILDPIMGQKEFEYKQVLEVYPNPTTGLIEVFLNNQSIDQVQVFDHQGKKLENIDIKQLSINKVSVNLNDHSNGIYYLEINSDGDTLTKKISLVK